MINWIDLEDEYPEKNKHVLVCDSVSGFISLGRLNENVKKSNKEKSKWEI